MLTSIFEFCHLEKGKTSVLTGYCKMLRHVNKFLENLLQEVANRVTICVRKAEYRRGNVTTNLFMESFMKRCE